MAIEAKYYNGGIKWEPKLNDIYTLVRQSTGLEVFKITDETDTQFGIKIIWSENGASQDTPSWFDKATFLEGFGANRVYLPDYIFK